LINRIHPSDLAAIIEDLNASDQASLVGSLDEETAADAFEQLDAETQLSILEDLSPDRAADIIENMSPDDAADILGEVEPEKQEQILRLMEPEEAKDVRELLTHDEETAGGLMTTEFLSVPPGLTVGATFDHIRKAAEDAELIYYVYVLDPDERLIGVVALKDLITASLDAPISSILVDDVVHVALDAPKEEVATTIARYDFLAVPVVDDGGRMHGIVTVDDVVDVLLPDKLRRMLGRVGKSRSKAKKAPR
jgi:Mg2+ transporter MgtE